MNALHGGIAGEVRVDELLRGRLGHADVLREREGRLSVEQRVIDDLGAAAQFVRVELQRPVEAAEHALRRAVVNVDPSLKRFGQRRVARQMRENSQLDLRVVGGNETIARLGDERRANLAAKRRADRDVLQVRIAAAEPAGRGHGLVERRVDASGPRD